MKNEELREMTSDELMIKKTELKEGMLHMRLQQQSGQLEDSAALCRDRRTIARIETILSQRRNKQAGAQVGV